MSFLDKAKKLAEQAAEKAGPLIDKAAPHAQNMVDKAGQQIDRRTGGKYRDKIDAVEAKVGELAERRTAARGDVGTATTADDGFPAAPGTAAGPATDGGFPAQPGAAAPATDASPAQPGAAAPATDAFPAQPAPVPAQPDLSGGQPDDPAHSGTPLDAGLAEPPHDDRASEPSFSAPTAEVTFPAQPPATTFPAEPDSAAGDPDDPDRSPTPAGSEFPGLSEGTVGTPEAAEAGDRPHPAGPAAGSSGGPTP